MTSELSSRDISEFDEILGGASNELYLDETFDRIEEFVDDTLTQFSTLRSNSEGMYGGSTIKYIHDSPIWTYSSTDYESEEDIEKKKKEFQRKVRAYLLNLPSRIRLNELVRLQQSVPFLLTDPKVRKREHGLPVQLGLADLYQFLSDTAVYGGNGDDDDEDYVVPNILGNALLDRIASKNTIGTMTEIQRLVGYYRRFGRMMNTKNKKAIIKRIRKLWSDYLLNLDNPIEPNVPIKFDELPMQDYELTYLYDVLKKYSMVNALANSAKLYRRFDNKYNDIYKKLAKKILKKKRRE